MDRIVELVEILNKYAHEYYVMDNPIVADKEYDILYDELKSLEESGGKVLENSPTKRIGGDVLAKFETYKHRQKLYSLDKVKSIAELEAYFDKLIKALGYLPSFTLEHKFDGLTISATYNEGKFVRATTRGDGVIGEDVTEQVKTMKSLPLQIDFDGYIEIVGEGIMKWSNFQKYNETAKDPLKNPRNGVSGAIRNLDPKITAKRNLDFVAYNINYVEGKDFSSQEEMNAFLVKNKFLTDKLFCIVNDIESAEKKLKGIDLSRVDLDFLIDGAVFKVNDINLRDNIGYTEKFPKWAMAFKFEAEEATTTLKDVIWQVSRTNKLNPLAILEPVELMGVTVKRATLNNIADIQKKGIKINSKVFIRRSNDVIPEIMGVSEHTADSIDIVTPTECPSCHSTVKMEGAFLYCTNDDCAPKIIAAMTHFADKQCMNIDGFSEKTAELLYNELGIDSVEKLYTLRFEELLGLDGFKDKKAMNLIQSLEESKNTTLPQFIFSLGIPNIGKKSARQLVEKFGLLEKIMTTELEALVSINDFGDIMAECVYKYFHEQKNLDIIEKLLSQGIKFAVEEKKEGIFEGYNVVFTGSLQVYKRTAAQDIVINLGGKVSDTISKAVNLVVVGLEAGSKLQKAEKLRIKVITETDFLEMVKPFN